MTIMRCAVGLSLSVWSLAASWQAAAQSPPAPIESPRWNYEIRGGYLRPDLDQFATFYGDREETYYGLAGSYRFLDWLEVGGEYGQMQAEGVGFLTSSQQLGGTVKYRLNPVHVFTNFIFQRTPRQRVVPYLGAGATVAAYEQEVESQPDRDGRTDIGYSVRAGVRFALASHGPMTSPSYAGSRYWRGYLIVEAQHMTFEVDDVDLGGDAYVLGFRMEFDMGSAR
jgi:opacity protein-like surface antigen